MKVYMAGYEGVSTSYNVLLPKDYNVFLTYFYKKNSEKCLQYMRENYQKRIVTIDSGAHTFFGFIGASVTDQSGKQNLSKMPDPNKYFEEYAAWLQQWHHYLDYFVELDLHVIVGYKRVKEWRQELIRNGLFKKCIPVHHAYNSMRDYDELLDIAESKYIGLEGIIDKDNVLPYNELLRKCYAKQVKAHCFAMTKPMYLNKYPFYSVDSSRWLNPVKYGCFDIWDEKKMELKTVKSVQKDFFKYNVDLGLHSANRTKETARQKLLYSADQYSKMEKHFTKLWEARGIHWKD